jgi:SAM-dependent methyltransferase
MRLGYLIDSFLKRAPLFRRPYVQRWVDRLAGTDGRMWSRVVMREDCERLLAQLSPKELNVLEISGRYYSSMEFAHYKNVRYPEFDICTTALDETFNLIIAEQVFEHLLWPYRAGRNVHKMLAPGGHFLISTPFLVRIHNEPTDCTRWTEMGIRYFLAECGFELETILTGSWGNRDCVNANFLRWTAYRPRLHSLDNESDYPYHVWALAKKK